MNPKILIAEDDANLGFVIADQLKAEGYKVTLCKDGLEAFRTFNQEKIDLCVLDVMMPKKDGFSLAKDIRKIDKSIPILFLTAKSNTEDKVEGFNSGGDDYLTKPFSSEEFSVRVKSLLKRVGLAEEKAEETEIGIGEFTFDTQNFTLNRKKDKQKLTKKEAQVLKMLCQFKNKVLPRETILNGIWGREDYFVSRSLDVFITKLRKYLAEDKNVEIENIHGIGFKLVEK